MPQEYCILNLLNIENKNVKLIENFYKFVKFENIKYKVIETTLSYELPIIYQFLRLLYLAFLDNLAQQ